MILIRNACEQGAAAGTQITLGAEVTATAVRLWVQDNGPGIPAEQVARLFERFGAGDSESTAQSNTGLGLTFCKLAVEAHAGTIVVESVVGQGTTFTLTFPPDIAVETDQLAQPELPLGRTA